MNPRIHQLSRMIRERQALLRFIRLSESVGAADPEWEESWHYRQSPEALRFFSIYERQMAEFDREQNWLACALQGIVGTE